MNCVELYQKIKELDAFNAMYKTKAVYQAQAYEEYDKYICSVHALGFVNHGKKYELLELAITDIDNTNVVYEFNEVDDFTNFTDKLNYIKIMNDSLEVPEDKIKAFFNILDCPIEAPEYIDEEDIILKDMVILCDKRKIGDRLYYGPYTMFFGKFIEKEEFDELLGKESKQDSLFKKIKEYAKSGQLGKLGEMIYLNEEER